MRRIIAASALLALASGCAEGTGPSVASGVTIAPGAVALDALGATRVVRATVTDHRGSVMRGAALSWSSSSTSVSVASAGGDSAVVMASGNGTSTVTARSGSATASLQVRVQQVAASAQKVAGDGQTAARGSAVGSPPAVRVRDAQGNPVAAVNVSFAVTSGGGSLEGAEASTDSNGVARVERWVLGAAGGTNTVTASLPGLSVASLVFTATAIAGGSIAVVGGDRQAGMAGASTPAVPAVLVRDEAGNPLPNVTVTFSVTEGGGSLSGATATTDANGRAAAAGWVLGAIAAPNAVTASVAEIASTAAVIRAVGCSGGGGGGYAMTLCFTTPVTSSQRMAYESAAVRWSAVIRGDLPGLAVSIPSGTCGATSPSLELAIDDLVIFAGIEYIDGPGAVLGQAGWCYRRSGGLPLIGLMRFDEADAARLESDGRFLDLVLHEMGHVLGLSAALWNSLGLLQDPSSGSTTLDTYFSGAAATAGFDGAGGTGYTGRKVPVENTGGGGTINSHWRESVLGSELMTGYLNTGANPLSAVTVGALADMGYAVDPAAADGYSLVSALRDGPSPPVLHLEDDEYDGPRYEIDTRGRRTRLPR